MAGDDGISEMKADGQLSVNASTSPELDRTSAADFSDGGVSNDSSGLAIDFGSRFVPYTALSACSLLFNCVALAALCFVRAPRTVHHRLLANLTVGDVVGTVLLWLYYNSPHIFARFEVNQHRPTAGTSTRGVMQLEILTSICCHLNRPRYGSCLSRSSVCPVRDPDSNTKRHRKETNKIGVYVPRGRSNRRPIINYFYSNGK